MGKILRVGIAKLCKNDNFLYNQGKKLHLNIYGAVL